MTKKRIRESQKVRIVTLFQGGTSIATLAEAWLVSTEAIEGIIREAMHPSASIQQQ